MEEVLKKELGTETLKKYGKGGAGCINQGEGFMTDTGPIFVKKNSKSKAKLMFDGEYESLSCLDATKTIRVPKPIKVIENKSEGECMLVTEYLDMVGGSRFDETYGRKMAELHLHNSNLLQKANREESFVGSREEEIDGVSSFGFHVPTCCGYLAQDNTWEEDWVVFYSKNRLKFQIDMILEKTGDRDVKELWPQLERVIPGLFKDLPTIQPSLLHGDLWSGNASEIQNGPVIFDPASFYGHSEYEFGIATMFGSPSRKFLNAYHSLIPSTSLSDKRIILYQLFHQLNHW